MPDSLSPAAYRQAFARATGGGSGGGGGGGSSGSGGSSSGSSGGGGFTQADYARARAEAEADADRGDAVDDGTDPERGDETTREPRPDQDSDPMREQTQEASPGDGGGATTRDTARALAEAEAEADRQAAAEQAEAEAAAEEAAQEFAQGVQRVQGGDAGVEGDDGAELGGGGGAPMPPSVEERERGAEQAADPRDELVDRDVGGGAPTPPTVEERERGAEVAQERRFSEVGIAGVPGQQDRISAAGAAVEGTPTNIARARGQVDQAISDLERDLSEQAGTELDFGEDFRVDEGGEVELTEEGERAIRGDEYEREVRDIPGELLVPLVGPGLAAAETAGVEQADVAPNLRFEDIPGQPEGATLEDVFTEATDAISEVSEEQAEGFRFTRGVGALASGAQFTPSGVEGAARPAMEPAAETEGTPAIEQGEAFFEGIGDLVSTPFSAVLAAEEVREFGVEAVDVAGTEGIGIEATDTPPRPIRAGPGSAVERPGREVSFSEEGVVPFVAEETAETGGQVVEGLEQELRSPTGRARLAGNLFGSALIMGGAAAVSSRAGLATRAAIQPGEELLGYGGFGVTRRVAGRGAAQRLFPNREPLIFSEEAAIRGARRGASAVRRGAGRARDVASRVDVSARPGIGAGGLRFEIESEPEADPSGLDPELEESLARAERGARLRGAEERAERQVAERQEELGPSEPYVQDPPEGWTAPDREPGFVASRQPDVGRSGPTERQQAAYRSSLEDVGTDLELTPRERQLAAQMETPGTDLRLAEAELARAERAQEPILDVEEEIAGRSDIRTETAIQPISDQLSGPIAAPDVEIGMGQATGFEIDERVESPLDTEFRAETETETETDIEQRFDFEFRSEVEAAEAELEFEFEPIAELEDELEIETQDEREFSGRRLRRQSALAPWVERVEFEGIDPITGR